MNIDLSKSVKTPKAAFNELFGNDNEGIKEISLCDLIEWQNQPFKPYSDSKLQELADDIKLHGVLSPIIVRPIAASAENTFSGYQILAGHNRARASRLAAKEKIPAIIKEGLSDDEAELIMLNTNLYQVDELLTFEKAAAYTLQLDALKRKTGKKDNSMETQENFQANTSAAELSELVGESKTQIYKYISLLNLNENFAKLVDNKEITVNAGADISCLSQTQQSLVYLFMEKENKQLTPTIAATLKKYAKEISSSLIGDEILNTAFNIKQKVIKNKEAQSNASKIKTVQFTIAQAMLDEYFPSLNEKEALHKILEILRQWHENENAD
ncbi:MAG: ParB/RepB/Spo0J family partition protein [Oscillospiraceae bacterium]